MKEDILLGIERLKSYESERQYYENLNPKGKIQPKIELLEVILRNLLDIYMSESDPDWIFCKDLESLRAKILKRSKVNTLSKEQFLSNFSLGDVIFHFSYFHLLARLANELKLNSFDFKSLAPFNKNYFYKKGRMLKIKNINKARVVLSLFSTLRNRAYHCENLLKTREGLAKITMNLESLVLGLDPCKIEFFLDHFLNTLNENFLIKLEKYKND